MDMSVSQDLNIDDPAALMQKTLGVMRDLTEVLVDEIDIVKRRDVQALTAIQPTKAKLILDYRKHLGAMASQPDMTRDAMMATKKELREAGERLADATGRNEATLLAARTATQNLLETFFRMVREENRATHCYVDPRLGGMPPDSARPVAVNRTV